MKTHLKNSTKIKLVAIVALLAFGIAGYFVYSDRFEIQQNVSSADVPPAVTFVEIGRSDTDVASAPDEVLVNDTVANEPVPDSPLKIAPPPVSEKIKETATSINLAVPFTSQAPHANWDFPYQEACEEASVLMAISYYNNSLVDLSTPDLADKAILDVVDFQTENYNSYLDTSASKTKRFAEALYPEYSFELYRNPTIDGIKLALSNGFPVIVPASGRDLKNPYFSGDGPLYHMLVIRGFTEDLFITNDPGTRRGEEFVYKQQVIMDAMGDWNDGDPVNGSKVVIVVRKR